MNKRGFTLIELLAVIVILAIIALIAVPIVLDIIKDSRESAGLRSAEMYLDAVEQAVSIEKMDNTSFNPNSCEITNGDLICDEDKENPIEVKVNGDIPKIGTITFEKGKIKDVTLNYQNDKTIVKNNEGKLVYGEKKKTLAEKIIEDAEAKNYLYTTPPDFSVTSIDGEYGLYSAEDDFGTSYYFRGDVENNYVKLGKWKETVSDGVKGCKAPSEASCVGDTFETMEACEASSNNYSWCKEMKYADEGNDMYWRIIRINGDGSIRLVYDGVEKTSNDLSHNASIGQTAYYTQTNKYKYEYKYVGYTYEDDVTGGQVDSAIKGIVETWYENNLEIDYGKYIADTIFCNDREVTSTSEVTKYYGAFTRLGSNKNPKLTCRRAVDKYTVSSSKGNGFLRKPVGLLTADELVLSGIALNGVNTGNYYLYTGMTYDWTMTPYTSTSMYYSFYYGMISTTEITTSNYDIRPVINLKANVKFTGKGTIDDPYVIVTE